MALAIKAITVGRERRAVSKSAFAALFLHEASFLGCARGPVAMYRRYGGSEGPRTPQKNRAASADSLTALSFLPTGIVFYHDGQLSGQYCIQ